MLGELKDARAIPTLIPLLTDAEIGYKVAWALGTIGDKSAIPPLIEGLKLPNSDVRIITIISLQELRATQALPALHTLLDDNAPSIFDTSITVARTAKRAIAILEK